MTKQAAAIVRIEPARVRDAFAAIEGKEDEYTGANGEPFGIVALDDATVVQLGISIASEPEELAERLEALLGELLDAHADPRGVPIYPSSHALEATGWDAAIEELGEAADWVSLEEDGGGLGDMLKAFGLGAGGLEDVQKIFAEGDRSALLSSAMRMAQEMAESGALEDLAKRMRIMQGADGGDEQWKQLERATATDRLGGLDLDELTKEARRMLEQNPELEEKLRSVFEAPDEEDEDGASEDEGE